MANVILTNSQLDTFLLDTINNVQGKYHPMASIVFSTLYQHGFRISELKDITSWQITIEGNVIAATKKNGQPRTIDGTELDQIIIDSIVSGQNYLLLQNYKFYNDLFQKSKPAKSLFVGGKELSTHAFRHNHIKKLSDGGKTLLDVKNELGIKHTSIVDGYKNSIITAVY